jgi:HK97 family phage major capsid protein
VKPISAPKPIRPPWSLGFGHGEIYANPAATQQMLDDGEINIEAWLASEVQAEFAEQEGLAFISGDGVKKPAGILTYVRVEPRASTLWRYPCDQQRCRC